jgi:hypothetical protein
MLAYVFWHWPNAQVNANTYQQHLTNFHRTLSEHKPPGFHYSRLLAMQEASWLGRTERTYEDWNIVENFAAFDPLNHGAVAGACLEPHNRVAQLAEGGIGGVYSLRFGNAHRKTINVAYRFNKPAGISYTQLYDQLQFLQELNTGDLWIRQMNLGPGPEFCLHSSEEVALPTGLNALKIPLKQIWSESTSEKQGD